jgi:hypothetical protein
MPALHPAANIGKPFDKEALRQAMIFFRAIWGFIMFYYTLTLIYPDMLFRKEPYIVKVIFRDTIPGIGVLKNLKFQAPNSN